MITLYFVNSSKKIIPRQGDDNGEMEMGKLVRTMVLSSSRILNTYMYSVFIMYQLGLSSILGKNS